MSPAPQPPRERQPDQAVRPTDAVRDPARLASLRATGLLDTAPDAAFDRLTRLVTAALGVPVALVSLVDAERQFFKSCVGLPEPWASARETPLSHSFCRHVVEGGEPLVVPDARAHPLVGSNLAIPDLGVVAYAGVPLVGDDGGVLGSLAAIDTRPRAWTERDLAILADLAATAATELGLRAAEARLREERAALASLNRVGKLLAAELDLGALLQAIVDAGVGLAGAAFGAFFYNAVGGRGEAYVLYALSGAPREAFARFPTPRATEVFGPTFRGEGPVRSADVRADPRYGRNPPHRGMPEGHLPVASYLAVPVVARSGEVLGGLFFGHPEPGVFGERTEELAVGLAAHAAAAVENARLYQRIQEAVRLRDEFLAAVSHDLKTPLTVVSGHAQLLRRALERGDRADPRRLLGRVAEIEGAAVRMAGMVDELLDVARLRAGEPLELRRAPTDLVALAGEAVAAQRAAAPDRAVRLEVDAPALVGGWDAARLRRVLENLLSNAVKYSPDGGDVVVRVARAEDPDGSVVAVLAVADDGVGIPAADLPHVFERFRRGGNVGAIAGSGIGLAGANRVVEQHGGTVSVESAEGRGSTFTVRLPLAPGEVASAAASGRRFAPGA